MSNTNRHKAIGKWKAQGGDYPFIGKRKKKTGSPIASCNCASCREGRKHGWGKVQMEKACLKHKRAVKAALKAGEFDRIQDKIPVGYTD